MASAPVPRDPSIEHRYNDDLLLDENVRHQAAAHFPKVFHVLDHPELREVFIPLNVRANKAKAWSQIAGSAPCCSRCWRSLAPRRNRSSPTSGSGERGWSNSSLCFRWSARSTAVALAVFGVLAGPRKEEWLHTRLFTERLRQFHFQTFIWRLPDIAASCVENNPQAQEEYRQIARLLVLKLHDALRGAARQSTQRNSRPRRSAPDVWLHETPGHRPILPDGFDPSELFAAYRKLCFLEQYGYVSHKLRSIGHTLNFLKLPIRTQERLLRYTWAVAFGLLIVLHAAIVVSHFANNVAKMRRNGCLLA